MVAYLSRLAVESSGTSFAVESERARARGGWP